MWFLLVLTMKCPYHHHHHHHHHPNYVVITIVIAITINITFVMLPADQVYRAQRRSCSNTGWVEKASILLALASLAQVNLER